MFFFENKNKFNINFLKNWTFITESGHHQHHHHVLIRTLYIFIYTKCFFFCLISPKTKWFVVVLHPEEKLTCDWIGFHPPIFLVKPKKLDLFFFATFFLWDPSDSVSFRRYGLFLLSLSQWKESGPSSWSNLKIHMNIQRCLFIKYMYIKSQNKMVCYRKRSMLHTTEAESRCTSTNRC